MQSRLPNYNRDTIIDAKLVAPRRSSLAVVVDSLQAARSVHPGGVAAVFGLAYLAGLAGSIVAPLVVAALLFGLFVARQSPQGVAGPVGPLREYAASSPLDTFADNGLEISSVTFKKPAANRARKQNV